MTWFNSPIEVRVQALSNDHVPMSRFTLYNKVTLHETTESLYSEFESHAEFESHEIELRLQALGKDYVFSGSLGRDRLQILFLRCLLLIIPVLTLQLPVRTTCSRPPH